MALWPRSPMQFRHPAVTCMYLFTGKRVKAEQKGTGIGIPLSAFYGGPLLSPSDAFVEQLCQDIHILAYVVQRELSSEDSSTNRVRMQCIAAVVSLLRVQIDAHMPCPRHITQCPHRR